MPKIPRHLVFKYLFEILLSPIYYFSCLIPKKNNIWIFGTFGGNKFAENSKYLFLYVKRNHPKIRPIWLTHKEKILQDLREKGFEVYKTFSFKGFIYSIQAACVVVNGDIGDINKFVTGGAKKIQLWHGIAPKKGPYEDKTNLFKFLANLRNRVFPFINPDWDIFITTSEENKKFVSSYFLTKKGNHTPIAGYPRDDALFDTPWLFDNKCVQLGNIRAKISFKYVFTYLPTYRTYGGYRTGRLKKVDLFEKYGFKINEAEKILKDLNAILIIKPHFNIQKLSLPIYGKKPQRIYSFSDDELPDVYPLLKETDILLGDYSSVCFDYLLLNRPIIFLPFDIDEYKKEEGFHYDYHEITPGPKAKNWPEAFNLIEKIMKKDDWKEKRKIICNLFYKYKDSKNSKRVFEAIKRILPNE